MGLWAGLRGTPGGDEGVQRGGRAHPTRKVGAHGRHRTDDEGEGPPALLLISRAAVHVSVRSPCGVVGPSAVLPRARQKGIVLHVPYVRIAQRREWSQQREQPAHIHVRVVIRLSVEASAREGTHRVREPREELVDAREDAAALAKVTRVDEFQVPVRRVLRLQRLLHGLEAAPAHDEAHERRIARGHRGQVGAPDPVSNVRSARVGDDPEHEQPRVLSRAAALVAERSTLPPPSTPLAPAPHKGLGAIEQK